MTQVPLISPRYQSPPKADGTINAAGLVYTYAAGTSTPKDTYTDSAGGTANANPVVLDAAGRASIWGSGAYKIVVKTSDGTTITTDDNYTSFSTGSGTTVTDSTFVIQDNSDATKQLQFQCSSIGTGTTTTITVPDGNATMATVAGTQTLTNKTLTSPTLTSPTITTPIYAAEATVTSASPDLGAGASNYCVVTGTTAITSFGSTATTTNPIYFGRFTGILTLTHNATSLILPGAANITTAAGDTFIAKYEGSGNWRVTEYVRASGLAAPAGLTTIASGNLATGSPTVVDITGIAATYRSLILYISGANNSVATRGLQIQVAAGGDAVTTATNNLWLQVSGTTTTAPAVASTSLWTVVTQTATQTTSAIIEFPGYQSGPVKRYIGKMVAAATDGAEWQAAGTHTRFWGEMAGNGASTAETRAITGMRITWDNVATGVFDGGTYALYGVN